MGLEPTNLLTASQALYQLSYAPGTSRHVTSPARPDLLGPVTRPTPPRPSAAGRLARVSALPGRKVAGGLVRVP